MKMTRVPIHGGLSWKAFNEETTTTDDSSFTVTGLLEQINATRDLSDYLWYSTEWVWPITLIFLLFIAFTILVITLLIYLLILFLHVEYLSCSFWCQCCDQFQWRIFEEWKESCSYSFVCWACFACFYQQSAVRWVVYCWFTQFQ